MDNFILYGLGLQCNYITSLFVCKFSQSKLPHLHMLNISSASSKTAEVKFLLDF